RKLQTLSTEPQPHASRRTGLCEAGKDRADRRHDGLVGMKQNLTVGLTPHEAHGQATPQLATCRLIANPAFQPGSERLQLGLAPRPLQPEQQTVVEQRRMIDAVGIPDQRVGKAGKIDCQSALLRASRDTSRPSTRPTRASATSAVRRAKPDRATEPEPERPRSSSMTRMRSSGQPSWRALAASAYWRSVDSRLCSTCAELDWRR